MGISPRMAFNSGYMKAFSDAQNEVVSGGSINTNEMLFRFSKSATFVSYQGYKIGLEHFVDFSDLQSEELAWTQFKEQQKANKKQDLDMWSKILNKYVF